MIKAKKSTELKSNNIDLVCTHCGQDHSIRVNGDLIAKEGLDYVFETDDTDEWCICVDCKEKMDLLESQKGN